MDTKDSWEKDIKEGFATIKAPLSLKNSTYTSCLHPSTVPALRPAQELKAIYDIEPDRIKKRRKQQLRTLYAFVACLAILLCGYGGYSAYATETAYISIDVNPSIELGLNRFDTVVSQNAFNEDGQAILDKVNLTHKSYEEALNTLLADPSFTGYLAADNTMNLMVITDDNDKEIALLGGIRQSVNQTNVHAICHGAGTDLREKASHSDMSAGKYQAYLELSELDDSVTVEDCHDMSISQINESIRTCHQKNTPVPTEAVPTPAETIPAPADLTPAPTAPAPADPTPNSAPGNGYGNGHHGGHHGSGHE